MPETPLSLLERLRRQPADDPSWRRLVELYTPLLELWLRRLSPFLQASDVEDLLQTVLLVVVRRVPEFQHNGQAGAFRRWLKSILGHCLQTHRRRHAAPTADAAAPPLEALEQPNSDLSLLWEREHDEYVLRRLLEVARLQFTPHVWGIFERVVLQDRRAAEVAEELQVTHDAVLKAKSRVVSWLRQESQDLIDS